MPCRISKIWNDNFKEVPIMATEKRLNARLMQKSDTSANWDTASKAANPFIPWKGEIIFYTDLNRIKIGDGVKTPNQLEFVSSTGDMAKATYDKDGNGIVDNAEKLGGVAASEYAKKTDIPTIPTIPTVNNGKLIIKQNGVEKGTFTANQSGNATANITVPTKTSELTNDSGFTNISYGTTLPSTGVNGQIFLLQG